MSINSKALLALFGTVLLWSVMAVVARIAVSFTSSFYILFLRLLVANIAFFPFFLIYRPWRKKQFKKLVLISLGSTINLTFFILGIAHTSASTSQLIYAAMPLVVLFVNTFLLHEKSSPEKILGVLIGFFGLFYILYQSFIENGTTITGSLQGNLFILIAMSGWTFYLLASKKIMPHFHPIEIGSTTILVSFVIVSALFFIASQYSPISFTISINLFLAVLYIGFCGTFLTYILYQYAIKHLSTLTVSLSNYIQPVTTTVCAMIFIGEKLTMPFMIGSILVLCGVLLNSYRDFSFK